MDPIDLCPVFYRLRHGYWSKGWHDHTRTKTGRVHRLNDAAPNVFEEISKGDAKELGISEGDLLEIATRRGKVEATARIGNILSGHLFLPFHYVYWDESGNGHQRAANELTITGYDPVSKQPFFKFAAARVRNLEREGS